MKLLYLLLFCLTVCFISCDNPTSDDNRTNQNQNNDDGDDDDIINTTIYGKWVLIKEVVIETEDGVVQKDSFTYNPSEDNYASAIINEITENKIIIFQKVNGSVSIDTVDCVITGNKIIPNILDEDSKEINFDTSTFSVSDGKLSFSAGLNQGGNHYEMRLTYQSYSGPLPPSSWENGNSDDNDDDDDTDENGSLSGKWVVVFNKIIADYEGETTIDSTSYDPQSNDFLNTGIIEFLPGKMVSYTYDDEFYADTLDMKISGNKIINKDNSDAQFLWFDTATYSLSGSKLILQSNFVMFEATISMNLILEPYSGPIPHPSWTNVVVTEIISQDNFLGKKLAKTMQKKFRSPFIK